jgi:hypothetical protein
MMRHFEMRDVEALNPFNAKKNTVVVPRFRLITTLRRSTGLAYNVAQIAIDVRDEAFAATKEERSMDVSDIIRERIIAAAEALTDLEACAFVR